VQLGECAAFVGNGWTGHGRSPLRGRQSGTSAAAMTMHFVDGSMSESHCGKLRSVLSSLARGQVPAEIPDPPHNDHNSRLCGPPLWPERQIFFFALLMLL
jgi:hypothetical protein